MTTSGGRARGRSTRLAGAALFAIAALAASTLVIAAVETATRLPNASAVYIVAVVGVAIRLGTVPALATSVAAFGLYNLLFVEPRFTLSVNDGAELLNLVLLLVVSVVVGRLAAAAAERAAEALAREREARTLAALSRVLATRESTDPSLGAVARLLLAETTSRRVWITVGDPNGPERVVADTGDGAPPGPTVQGTLHRDGAGLPARWVRVHQRGRGHSGSAGTGYRVRVEAGGRTLGSLWILRAPDDPPPDPVETRLLAAAGDQIGQVVEHDRLAAAASAAAVARDSDALKTALLESVSHDLRTPLASIRAAAGTLLDPVVRLDDDERRASAAAIDREAEHLARLVNDLLDLGRIESGTLHAELDVYEVDELVADALARLRPQLDGRSIDVALDHGLPPALVDPLFVAQILANLLENAARYAPAPAPIRVAAQSCPGLIRLTVEDGGPGVTDDALPRLFDKFFRVKPSAGGRPGTGVGLAVVRGLALAMGASVAARRSSLGGLAVDVDVPEARLPQGVAP